MEIRESTYQSITEKLQELRQTNQVLLRYGTEHNRDILAGRFESSIREIQEALNEVEIVL